MESLLKTHNLKVTASRLAVLELLNSIQTPLDVPSIIELLARKHIKMDRVTAFRIINIFTNKGITRKIELQEGKARYELTSRPHHHHAVCIKCRTIVDLPICNVQALERKVTKDLSFTVQSHTVDLFGLCAKSKSLI